MDRFQLRPHRQNLIPCEKFCENLPSEVETCRCDLRSHKMVQLTWLDGSQVVSVPGTLTFVHFGNGKFSLPATAHKAIRMTVDDHALNVSLVEPRGEFLLCQASTTTIIASLGNSAANRYVSLEVVLNDNPSLVSNDSIVPPHQRIP